MELTKKTSWDTFGVATVAILGALVLAFAGRGIAEEAQIALPASTVTRAIDAAVAAKAGNVAGVEIESENGITEIDVEIVAASGEKYEVSVNAATGQVIAVELDDDNQKEVGEKDGE